MEQNESGAAFYDWNNDFTFFKNSINVSTEQAKNRFEKKLNAKVVGRGVVVRASKGQYKQPVKDYTINKVSGIYLYNYNDEWVVVFKNENGKEFFLQPGYKIKISGPTASSEPASAIAPTQPEKPVNEPTPQPQQSAQQPVKEELNTPFYDTLDQALNAVEEYIIKNSIQVAPTEHPSNEADQFGIREPFLFGGIPYGQSKKSDYKLVSYKGRPTRKYLHVNITRMDTGRYELTNYVL